LEGGGKGGVALGEMRIKLWGRRGSLEEAILLVWGGETKGVWEGINQ